MLYLKIIIPEGYGFDNITYWEFDFDYHYYYDSSDSSDSDSSDSDYSNKEENAVNGFANIFERAIPEPIECEILNSIDLEKNCIEESFKNIEDIKNHVYEHWNCGETAMQLFWDAYD
jgi:hypothetical protein